MSKFIKAILVVALATGVFSAAAEAAGHGHGGGHGGGFHGGGFRGGGWGGAYWGPYPYYSGPSDCGWVSVRVLRGGHWVVRRAWRCW